MGFYSTQPLEPAAQPPVSAERARRNPSCGRKPLRGPMRKVRSGYRFYAPDLGRWCSRDPLAEEWAWLRYTRGRSKREKERLWSKRLQPLYLFVENRPVVAADAKGLEPESWVTERKHQAAQCCCIRTALRTRQFSVCLFVRNVFVQAIADTRDLGDELDEGYDDTDEYEPGDYVNAYMHCVGSCRLTQLFMDPSLAWRIEMCHERPWGGGQRTGPRLPGRGAEDERIDLTNNAEGNRLGNLYPQGNCMNLCELAIADDRLALE